MYFAFLDLVKVFDRVPRHIVWWALRKLVVKESLVKILQPMRRNARSRGRVNGTSEAVAQRCSVRKVFLEISQNSRKTPVPESLF